MRNALALASFAAFSIAAVTSPLWAEMEGKAILGDLHIEGPMLRATPPNAPVAGGFVTVENTGTADDILIAATIADDVAAMVELHEMELTDGIMSMKEVDGGIAIPAGETVSLVPGGLHLMLMGLKEPLVKGQDHEVTLTFETAGEVTMTFPVLDLAEIRAVVGERSGGHGDGHGNHGN
ncbi:MAG: copper chaperone PCu(A)C [Pseudomonadota bacterium]